MLERAVATVSVAGRERGGVSGGEWCGGVEGGRTGDGEGGAVGADAVAVEELVGGGGGGGCGGEEDGEDVGVFGGGFGEVAGAQEGGHEGYECVAGFDGRAEELLVETSPQEPWEIGEYGGADVGAADGGDDIAVGRRAEKVVLLAEDDVGHDVEGEVAACAR